MNVEVGAGGGVAVELGGVGEAAGRGEESVGALVVVVVVEAVGVAAATAAGAGGRGDGFEKNHITNSLLHPQIPDFVTADFSTPSTPLNLRNVKLLRPHQP